MFIQNLKNIHQEAQSRLNLATIDRDFKAKLLEDNVIFGATLTPEIGNKKMEIWLGQKGQGAAQHNPIVWCDMHPMRTKAIVTLADRKITTIKPGDTSDRDNATKRKAFIIKQTDQPMTIFINTSGMTPMINSILEHYRI